MIAPPSVIAVDDNAVELATVVGALRDLDIACLPIHVVAGSPKISSPLKGVRLVFFDINYLAGVVSETAMFDMAANILQRALALDNGPYVLVTWTSKSDLHDRLMAYFAGLGSELPAPAVTGCLAKERFGPKGEGRVGGPSLREAITEIVRHHPQVEALLQWELSARRAAGDVIGALLNTLPHAKRFGASGGEDLRVLLAMIAREAVGAGNVAADRRGAMNEALVPLLHDRLMHQAAEYEEQDAWARAIPDATQGGTPAALHGPMLNALTHFAFPGSSPMNAGDRGVVFTLPAGVGAMMAERSGLSLQELASNFLESMMKGANKPVVPSMNEVDANCRWVFLGVRAICDQAQCKGTMMPVVLGLELNSAVKKGGVGLRITSHGALHLTPTFSLPTKTSETKKADRKLLVNWHWLTSLASAELANATVLYRLREPLMVQTSVEMSNYTSRPGIVSFGG